MAAQLLQSRGSQEAPMSADKGCFQAHATRTSRRQPATPPAGESFGREHSCGRPPARNPWVSAISLASIGEVQGSGGRRPGFLQRSHLSVESPSHSRQRLQGAGISTQGGKGPRVARHAQPLSHAKPPTGTGTAGGFAIERGCHRARTSDNGVLSGDFPLVMTGWIIRYEC